MEERFFIASNILRFISGLLNLSEQITVYFVVKQSETTPEESELRKLFFIFFALGAAFLFKSCGRITSGRVFISLLIETGELIAYLCLLQTTHSLIVTVCVFYVVQVLLYSVSIGLIIKSRRVERLVRTKLYLFPTKIVIYALVYHAPILYLFLQSNSPYRDTFYEVLMILNIFIGCALQDVLLNMFITYYLEVRENDTDSDDSGGYIGEIFEFYWNIFLGIVYSVLYALIIFTTLIYGSQELYTKPSLPSYDHGLYIYSVVGCSVIIACFIIGCCSWCIHRRSDTSN